MMIFIRVQRGELPESDGISPESLRHSDGFRARIFGFTIFG